MIPLRVRKLEFPKNTEGGRKMTTVYGHDEIVKFIVNHTKLVAESDKEFRYHNVLFIVEKSCMHVRVYTDYTRNTCIASTILFYRDFAIQYDAKSSNITLVSRRDGRVSSEMYISIKNILGGKE